MMSLDVKGLPCPMPLIKLKKALAQLSTGESQILIEATDKGVLKDIPAFCQQQGLSCELISEVSPFQLKVTK